MSRFCGLLLAALLVAAGPASLTAQAAVSSPGVHEEPLKGAEHLVAAIPGYLISYTFARDGAGGRTIFLLVRGQPPQTEEKPKKKKEGKREADEPRPLPPCPVEAPSGSSTQNEPTRLYRLDLKDRAIVLLREDLPADAAAIDAVDIDGDGRDELVLGRQGQLLDLPLEADRPLTPLIEDEAFLWAALHPRAVRRPSTSGRPWASMIDLGTLTVFGPVAEDDVWRVRTQIELPLAAKVSDTGVQVWSPTPRPIGESSDGRYFFATAPDDSSETRVQTTLVQATDTGESSVIECWARLPEPEEVLGSEFLILDDEPILMVTTKPADKLSLFGEQRLRLYPLRRDRSRLGVLPLFATETRMNMWQDGLPTLLDVNNDDRIDLVLGYWKGILKDRVVLDAYIRGEDGSFKRSAQTTAFDVPKGDRSFVAYGKDLDGDAIPDMLIRGKSGLIVYPGRRSKTGKNLVAERPRKLKVFGTKQGQEDSEWFFDVGGDGLRPQIADLDGDGVYEILVLERGLSNVTATRFHVLRVDR